jgi:phosphopantetheinyl transferase (holo-ACP synthase)
MADASEILQELVAHFLRIPPETIAASTPLNGALTSSLGRARLDAAVRQRLGVTLRGIYSARTFGDLQSCANSEQRATPAPVSAPATVAQPSTAEASVGFDLQDVKELPECTDYWSDPFYSTHFTAAEIAAGLLHPRPRTHYAAVWSTKEAIKKADAGFMSLDWRQIEVRQGADRRPVAYVQHGEEWRQLPVTVSITHSGSVAGAMAVYLRAASSGSAATGSEVSPALVQPASSGRQRVARKHFPWAWAVLVAVLVLISVLWFVRP